MRDQLGTVLVLYLGLVALTAGAAAAGARCLRAADTGAVVAQVLLVALAVADVSVLASGRRPASMGTHVGYLIVSVTLLPLLAGPASPLLRPAGQVGDTRGGRARGRPAVLTLTCLALAVVVVRQSRTGPV
jgi:hypothetical protein